MGQTSRVLSEGSCFHGARMLSLPNLRWGSREDVSTSRRDGEVELAGRALLSEGRARCWRGRQAGVGSRPIPGRQRQECQPCGRPARWHRRAEEQWRAHLGLPSVGRGTSLGVLCGGAGVSRGCRLVEAAEGDEEEKEVRGPEGGVRRNWKLRWAESVRWPRAKFPALSVLSALWGASGISGLPSSRAEGSDSGAVTPTSPAGALSLATAALDCTTGRSVGKQGAVPPTPSAQLGQLESWLGVGRW